MKINNRRYFCFISSIFLLLIVFIYQSCEIEKPEPPFNEGNQISMEEPVILDSSIASASVKTYIYLRDNQVITHHGHCWSFTVNANLDALTTRIDNGVYDHNEDGSFTNQIPNLDPYTTYYVWAYVQYGDTKIYSRPARFRTLPTPTVSTNQPHGINSQNAWASGYVSGDEGCPLVERGICWNINSVEEPDLSDIVVQTTFNSPSFTLRLSGLIPGAEISARAYVKVLQYVSYGETVQFNTPPQLIDIESNAYNVAEIGTQTWMAENLRTTQYANGTPLVDGTGIDSLDYFNIISYYFAYDDNPENINTYGLLYTPPAFLNGDYNATTVPNTVQGVCPNGWHMPSINEWDILINYVGGEAIAGGKLREFGYDHWTSIEKPGSDLYGFTALPGGIRDPYLNSLNNSYYSGLGLTAIFASSTFQTSIDNVTIAKAMWGGGDEGIHSWEWAGKGHAIPVRCIKDD